MKTIGAAILCAVLCSELASGQTCATYGANVNEATETALITVDQTTGNDLSPCQSGSIFQHIQVAANCALTLNELMLGQGQGTKVTIDSGIYRESITLIVSGIQNPSLAMTFEAAPGANVVISGADQYTNWQVYSGNNSIYTNSWPYAWGVCPNDGSGNLQQDIVLRREMVFVNGVQMTQVMALGEMQPGTFYVDEAGATIYLWPPAGTQIDSADVEVATDHNLPGLGAIEGLFNDFGESNVVLRNLNFQYDNSCAGSSAVTPAERGTAVYFTGATNVLLDTDIFSWNNAGGLSVDTGSANIQVQNSHANHNGELGMNSTKTICSVWTGNETSYNDWRGAQGVYQTFGGGAFHFYQAHRDQVLNHTSLYNQTHGIHFDFDSSNINNSTTSPSNLFSSGNFAASLLIEKSGGEGPLELTGSNFCNGNAPVNSTIVNGVSVNQSEQVSLTNDVIYNGGDQLTIGGMPGKVTVSDWEPPFTQYHLNAQSLTLDQDTIDAVGSSQNVFYDALGNTSKNTDWTDFTSTLMSNNNTWWNTGGNTNVFGLPTTSPLTFTNLAGWQAATGQDSASVFAMPTVDPAIACAANADAPDYWLTASTGQVTVHNTVPAVFTATLTSIGGMTGTANLTYDVSSIPNATATWSPSPATIGGTSTFTVNTPSTTPDGNYPVVMIATSGSVTRATTVEVVIDNNVGVSPTSISFPNTPINTNSSTQMVTLTNNGNTTLTQLSVALASGPDNNDFSLNASACGNSLLAGASCLINVTFTPKVTGLLTATIQISNSDPTSPQTVALSGTGTAPVAVITPLSLSFGNQIVNTPSPAQVVTVMNTGNATLDISKVSLTGTSFTMSKTCGTTLAPGASCTVSVVFKPKVTGAINANLNFTLNSMPSFVSVALSGTGVQPVASLTPSTLNFGSVTVGTTSPPMTATLSNTGTAALTITSINTNKLYYQISSNMCGTSLGIGQSCSIMITFKPSAKGTQDGTLTVLDNGKTTKQTASLQGTGM
ncbi:MAG TPA: choice-of-anchor D domain-containing protein [Terriglobia bacterium]|nr:choice-of-anchor D domain-containing protein [Terriglobia bacterium]